MNCHSGLLCKLFFKYNNITSAICNRLKFEGQLNKQCNKLKHKKKIGQSLNNFLFLFSVFNFFFKLAVITLTLKFTLKLYQKIGFC